jgi:hypothetical protein
MTELDATSIKFTPEKRNEFLKLFEEFVRSYLLMPQGEKHLASYEEGRKQARINLAGLIEAKERGEDVTEQILLKLLPYADTASNREKGLWISTAWVFMTDARKRLEASGRANREDWPLVAGSILNFVRRCDEHSDQFPMACTEFASSPYSKGFQTGILTPILNALHPDKFVIFNNKSRSMVEYFTGISYSQKIAGYPRANAATISFIENLAEEMLSLAGRELLPIDLFDMFSNWLVTKDPSPIGVSYWKIAPGENAWNWDACLKGGFMAIGWEELGDVSSLNRPQFNAKRDQLLAEHSDWNKNGVEQVWKFAHIKQGDRIIANKGTTEVLGIGTVTGPYYFVGGIQHGHRIPVEWEDFAPRRINKPGWRRTLIELNKEEFDEIIDSSGLMDIYRFFKDQDEAKWAFDLLRETLARLGIKDPNDERFAITNPLGSKALHLIFGQWLVLGFSDPDDGPNRLKIALLADRTKSYDKFESFDFAKGEDELNIRLYKLPISLVKPLEGDMRAAYEKSLEHIADKFGDWHATPFRKNDHIPEIAEALFDSTALGGILDQGFQRNIWWVNQGDSIKSEREDGVLCAPIKTENARLIPHWERLVEIGPEDVIVHYANGNLLYVSRATAAAVTANRPYGRFDEVHLVKVDYQDLNPPIPLSKFSEDLQKLAIKDGPLNITGGVKEGYLWRFNLEGLKIIQSSQPETKWPEFAILGRRSSWIFQANPDIFDIDGAIRGLEEITWKVNRYKDRVHAGDTAYFWRSGENAGIVALGKILSEPALVEDLETEKRYIRPKAAKENEDEKFLGVRISVEHVLESMIKRQDLLNDPLLKSMQILLHPQGTNFILIDEEAKAIHDLVYASKQRNPEYSLEQCSKETGLDESTLKRWIKAIERKGQAIIYGPPGTGKTFIAEHLAEHLIGGGY